MRDPLNMGSAANFDSYDQTPLPLKTPSTSEHVFPAPSLNWAGKDANEHSLLWEESKQVTDSYNLARRLPDGESSTDTKFSFAKTNPKQIHSKPVYELWIEGSLVAVSRSLRNFHPFTSRASPLSNKEVGELYQFQSPNGEWVEIRKINQTKERKNT